MAPEQFQGRASIQSDLYGLGATLVHLLSHVPPAELPQDGLQLDFHESVKASPGTVAWLDRMLQGDPRERFATAKEALAALRRREVAEIAVAAPRAALERRALPHGSRILAKHGADGLYLVIPGTGFSGDALKQLPASIFALIFLGIWTSVAGKAGGLFAAFSIVAWTGLGWSFFQSLFAMFGRTTLQLGAKRYVIRRRLFGYERRFEGPTAHLEGAGIHRSKNRNGTSARCVLHTGVKSIKFGGHLSVVERHWLVELINEQLGVEAEAGELDE